ncbi:MAG: sel1 repeat family protein [Herminiimonas sp.]|nr:sel1 repeat family protein [Herminiimonas sp.]
MRNLEQRVWMIAAVLLALAAGMWWALRDPDLSRLPPADIDRLRMHADHGKDASALKSLRLAASQGHAGAMQAAASVLLHHPQWDRDGDGLLLAQAAAQHGDSSAQYLLAKAYFDGAPSRQRDATLARQWFEKAAGQKHPQAAYLLGLIYKNGDGTAADPGQSAQWFERSAQLGNPDAMFMLANAHLAGEGVERNPREALRLYMTAAALEHPLAAQSIALAFKEGQLGLPQSERQSQQMMLGVAHSLRHPHSAF